MDEEISKYQLDSVAMQELRWEGGGTEPVARMGEKRNAYRYRWESQKERDH
jgi:hypothetical protein